MNKKKEKEKDIEKKPEKDNDQMIESKREGSVGGDGSNASKEEKLRYFIISKIPTEVEVPT